MSSHRKRTPSAGLPTHSSTTFPSQHHRKPLLEYCTNEWRNTPAYDLGADSDSESEEFLDRVEHCVEQVTAVVKAPKFRRLLLILVCVTVSSVLLWIKIFSPFVTEERAVWASLNKNVDSAAGGLFGTNVRPHFPGMIHVETLDPALLPRSSGKHERDGSNQRRLVFVGDIHGCREELEALLEKLHFDPQTDHLVAAGDIVAKGPDTRGVIDLLRGYKASCVRGNHEDRLLLILEDLQSTSLRSNKNSKSRTGPDDVGAENADEALKSLAMSLDADHVAWLKSCPVILRLGELKAFHGEAVVVHAGLVPGLPLEQQDPASVMNMRILDLATHVPSKAHEQKGSVPWFQLWNKYQQLLPARQRLAQLKSMGRRPISEKQMTVIYGHDAKKGLQIKKYTKGLDSNCVKGGMLTALVVDATGKQDLFQVDCKDHRKRPPLQKDVDDILRSGKPGPPLGGATD